MKIRPVTLSEAQDFVSKHHRHNSPPQGHRFSIGLASETGELIGVVICGRPIARMNDDGETAEITRCCVLPDIKNANSMLYGAAVRAAKAMGYTRIVTYTLPSESGVSLRAAGFRQDGMTATRKTWSCQSRPRVTEKYPEGKKVRWIHT